MGSDLTPSISVKFKGSDEAHRIVRILLKLEKAYPRAFFDTVEWLQEMFEKSHLIIGTSTVMAGNEPSADKESKDVLNLKDYMAWRFRNPEMGQQIITTLMELEARVEGSLQQISIRVEATLKELMTRQGPLDSGSVAQIVDFKKNRNSPNDCGDNVTVEEDKNGDENGC